MVKVNQDIKFPQCVMIGSISEMLINDIYKGLIFFTCKRFLYEICQKGELIGAVAQW